MKLLLGQVSPVIGDVQGNLARCLAAVEEARAAGCRLVVLPELVLSGYPPRDLLERADLVAACRAAAMDLVAASHGGLIVVFGVPWRDDEGLRNAAIVAWDGRLVRVVCKSLLPTYDVFDEHRYFVAEEDPHPVEVAGLRLGVTICEDIWHEPALFPHRTYDIDPIDCMVDCDLVLNLSASPFHTGKAHTRLALVRKQAADARAPLVYCNQVGGNDELLFDGQSLVVTADGRLLVQGPQFQSAHLVVDLDGPEVPFHSPGFEAEVFGALVMGVRDYATRCGFSRALVGLSGGIDSALVACVAAEALGSENLWTIGMPGPFSSQGSIDDAAALAANLGVRFDLLPIHGVYDAYLDTLAGLFAGRDRDVTEENLQARTRGALLMAVSNKFGHLLLTTGNKSELAVGYCTLYGDMCGGLAVISDLFKTDVYRVCRWLNRDGPRIPESILTKPPSAELAPGQTDQDSLPPYPVLDAILRMYIEELIDPVEIVARGHDPALVRRVVSMVVRSEYKRWQMPPGLRVTSKAFGSGRRIPLAQRWHTAGGGLPN
ncbi:MAG: NAD+ synthase [Deltaproteobacteria bacterium]|nr:MAG: NAD+ synthase [Deltaproteobacteria bacterium]